MRRPLTHSHKDYKLSKDFPPPQENWIIISCGIVLLDRWLDEDFTVTYRKYKRAVVHKVSFGLEINSHSLKDDPMLVGSKKESFF